MYFEFQSALEYDKLFKSVPFLFIDIVCLCVFGPVIEMVVNIFFQSLVWLDSCDGSSLGRAKRDCQVSSERPPMQRARQRYSKAC